MSRDRVSATPSAGGTDQEPSPDAPLHRTPGQVVKDIVLLFAAPFITMAYMALFAIIGIRMLLKKDDPAWDEWHATE